jgi:hypothetical protein
LLDAYRHIQRMETQLSDLNRQMAFDDPIIMARYVAQGDALEGDVTRIAGTAVTVDPALPFERPAGTRLWWRTAVAAGSGVTPRPIYIELELTDVNDDGSVNLTVRRGAVRADVRDRLPAVGAHVVFAPFGAPTFYRDTFPEELPWTHRPET